MTTNPVRQFVKFLVALMLCINFAGVVQAADGNKGDGYTVSTASSDTPTAAPRAAPAPITVTAPTGGTFKSGDTLTVTWVLPTAGQNRQVVLLVNRQTGYRWLADVFIATATDTTKSLVVTDFVLNDFIGDWRNSVYNNTGITDTQFLADVFVEVRAENYTGDINTTQALAIGQSPAIVLQKSTTTPTVTATMALTGNTTATAGQNYVVTVTPTVTPSGTASTISGNWGDGTTGFSTQGQLTHVFANSGTYTITATVTAGTVSDTKTLTVNVAPVVTPPLTITVNANPGTTGTVGEDYSTTFTLSFSTQVSDAPKVTISGTDGVFDENPTQNGGVYSFKHSYTTVGKHKVVVTATVGTVTGSTRWEINIVNGSGPNPVKSNLLRVNDDGTLGSVGGSTKYPTYYRLSGDVVLVRIYLKPKPRGRYTGGHPALPE